MENIKITTQNKVNPGEIIQVGMGFMASKVLLAATKLELFTHLGNGALSSEEIKSKMGIKGRGAADFLDALVSLGFLLRDGNNNDSKYSNSPETDFFLDKNKPTYIGGILEMANDRLYGFWGDLEEGLKTGKPQNEIKNKGESFFEELYKSPENLEAFIDAMNAIQMQNFMIFSKQFDFSRYKTMVDMGGASALLSIQVALNNEHMKCTSLDLPPVEPIAKKTIDKFGMTGRVSTTSGDFFTNDFPKADIITMGNILHDWNLEKKKHLIKKAYDALPENGAFVVIESIIDDDRRENPFGLLISLNMLIEGGDAFNFSHSEFDSWAKEVGFRETKIEPLDGINSAVIAFK
jgi:hypothetical protein